MSQFSDSHVIMSRSAKKFIYKTALVYNILLITILHNICERDECTIVTLLKPFKDFVIFQGFLVAQ